MRNFMLSGLLTALMSTSAHAGLISYVWSGTFSSASGGDTSGLDGASFLFDSTFDDINTYVLRFGIPAIIAESASLTISGATNAANNGLFSFNTDLAFYPTFAGIFSEPGGVFLEAVLGTGVLTLDGNSTPSAGSANVIVGGGVELDDFVAATYDGLLWSIGGEDYDVTNVRISANALPESAVPAPASLALLGLGLLSLRMRRKA